MAKSPSHQFGQIIGDVLEQAIEPCLRSFAKRENLYLDKVGPRAARKGRKVSWIDSFGNSHDLDFVLERGGTRQRQGTPVAFIESAWRRYTKHSKNKAQEIQGAILPVCARYEYCAPFKGAILAGDFTDNALAQMRSEGFTILHFTTDTVVDAFSAAGVDASSTEDMPDKEFRKKITAWERLSARAKSRVAARMIELNQAGVDQFMQTLERCVRRQIALIVILPLHGTPTECVSVEDAIHFITDYGEQVADARPVARYEVQIRYNNRDNITGQFRDKDSAIEFLQGYLGR